jgi:hypothetical protein
MEAEKYIEYDPESQLYDAILEALDLPQAQNIYADRDGEQELIGQVCTLPLDGIADAVTVGREVVPDALYNTVYVRVKKDSGDDYTEIQFSRFRRLIDKPESEVLPWYVYDGHNGQRIVMPGKDQREIRMQSAQLSLERAITEARQPSQGLLRRMLGKLAGVASKGKAA